MKTEVSLVSRLLNKRPCFIFILLRFDRELSGERFLEFEAAWAHLYLPSINFTTAGNKNTTNTFLTL